jgi:hypothetical protein
MRATISNTSGTAVELEGTEAEISHVVSTVFGENISFVPARRGPGRPPKNAAANDLDNGRRPSKPVSPERRKQMALQGAYMAAVRALPSAKKTQVKSLAKEKGIAAALKLAKQLAASDKK